MEDNIQKRGQEKVTSYLLTQFYVELYFGSIPSKETREGLKICGWKWNNYKKCWYNRRTDENIGMADSFCKKINGEENPLINLPKYTVDFCDIVLRCNSFYCNLHHQIEDVAGIISYVDRNGKWRERTVPLALCHDCNTFFILEETYKDMKKWGVIGCQVMKKTDYEKYGREDLNSPYLKEQGPLKQWGYSVSKSDGLTDEQRQEILAKLINHKLMTKDRILSYLDFFCRLGIHDDSIECWKKDRNFVVNYVTEGLSVAIINYENK